MLKRISLLMLLLCAMVMVAGPRPAAAQEAEVWLQLEAHPDAETALDRARSYAAAFPETAGFQLRSGWYAVLLGPYPADEAALRLDSLKGEGRIPADAFVAYARDLGDGFWPEAGAAPAVVAADPEPLAPAPADIPDETKQEARDSEAILTDEDRQALQVALQWFGFYAGAIDGDYGPGTRKSMSAWQEAQGLDPTGILTTRQRAALLGAWRDETAAFGFATVTDAEAGITLTLPMGLVAFDHYEPPFAHYRASAPDAPQIVLISQPGDQAAFFGLYDILQSLESVPLDGARERGEQTFRIRGTSATVDTTVVASFKGGMIKGWMLISAPGNETRDARIIQAIESSFASDGSRALDPGMVPMTDDTRTGLLSGLEVRKPRLSRTGFFVTAEGAVLTTAEAVDGCARVTIDRTTEASVTLADKASGLALLTPVSPLSPRAVAGFATTSTRPGAEVTVPGYSYEDRLPAPALTFGTLEDVTGLNGEPGLRRLGLQALPGDAGGPVLDGSGAVIGMLLPAAAPGGKTLPPGVAFALASDEIARLLTPAGVTPVAASAGGVLAPADLTDRALDMTALVSCWD